MGTGIPISPNKRHEIAAYILNNPTKNYSTLAAELGVSHGTIEFTAKLFNIQRKRGKGSLAHPGRKKVVFRG